MKNKESTIDFIRVASNSLYGKEMFFYDEDLDKCYSRLHCDYISFEEVLDTLKEDIYSISKQNNSLY